MILWFSTLGFPLPLITAELLLWEFTDTTRVGFLYFLSHTLWERVSCTVSAQGTLQWYPSVTQQRETTRKFYIIPNPSPTDCGGCHWTSSACLENYLSAASVLWRTGRTQRKSSRCWGLGSDHNHRSPVRVWQGPGPCCARCCANTQLEKLPMLHKSSHSGSGLSLVTVFLSVNWWCCQRRGLFPLYPKLASPPCQDWDQLLMWRVVKWIGEIIQVYANWTGGKKAKESKTKDLIPSSPPCCHLAEGFFNFLCSDPPVLWWYQLCHTWTAPSSKWPYFTAEYLSLLWVHNPYYLQGEFLIWMCLFSQNKA